MFQQKKPYTAVTVTIDNLTADTYACAPDDLGGIVELIEVIGLQTTGPAEAARAIRKKLKYGSAHRQMRALVLLDGLIGNAGPRFRRALADDEPLLERLRVCAASDATDVVVRNKCRELFGRWAHYGKTPGLERISRLHKELPKRKVVVTQERSRVIRETEENPFGDEEEEEATRRAVAGGGAGSGSGSSSSHKRSSSSLFHLSSKDGSASSSSTRTNKISSNKKSGKQRKPFNLEAEKEQMKTVIAESSMASIDLLNALKSINRERERISENQTAVYRFEVCKQLRRRVLRYIHHVEHEQWLGSLLHANDELVHALVTYEQLDQSIDADSDSDDEIAEQAHMYRMMAGVSVKGKENSQDVDSTGGRQGREVPVVTPGADLESASEEEDDDEENPFADRNVVV